MTARRAFVVSGAGVVGAVVGLAVAVVGFCLGLDALFNARRRRRVDDALMAGFGRGVVAGARSDDARVRWGAH